jgi:uracil-DNA glycosylase
LSARSRLDLIAAKVSVCQLCPLAGSRTKAVPGEGPGSARMMLIGEAPGREEDFSGRPFVGRGGKLLSATLEAIGSSREDVFITNVVKCRPPRNRVPLKPERETCLGAHLSREIEAVAPKAVVLLGRTATVSLLGVSTLKETRGKLVDRDGRTYLPTYHPAAILRNPKLKRTFQRDLRNAFAASKR